MNAFCSRFMSTGRKHLSVGIHRRTGFARLHGELETTARRLQGSRRRQLFDELGHDDADTVLHDLAKSNFGHRPIDQVSQPDRLRLSTAPVLPRTPTLPGRAFRKRRSLY